MNDIAVDIAARALKQDNGCWLWPGAKTPQGYGKIGRGGVTLYVHRVMHEAHVGPIPPGNIVMHSCDEPSCCNPDHLRVGTQSENLRDMVDKGRSKTGETHHAAKITEAHVRAIRARHECGERQNLLADAYGVTKQHINAIVKRKTWAHVP